MKNQKVDLREILFNILICYTALTIAAIAFFAVHYTATKIGNFVLDHNFAVEKYSGTFYYVVGENEENIFAIVIDSQNRNHVFIDQKEEKTTFLTDKHRPKDEAQVQVLELKIYNSRTGVQSSINIVW